MPAAPVEEAGVPGVGLGHRLARAVADAHGGTLRTASGYHPGTTVTVRLPAGVPRH